MKFVIGIAIVCAVALSGVGIASAASPKAAKRGQQMKAVQIQKKVVKKVVKKQVKVKKMMAPKKNMKGKEVVPAKKNAMQGSVTPLTGNGADSSSLPAPQEAMIAYSENGFSPASVTVKLGAKVKFVNQGTASMWVASAMHPTHQIYPEFDQKTTGNEYTFEFTKAGSWNYHNHVNPGHYGKVIVE